MRTREEVCRLMGAKDREVDDIAETDAGTVVNIRGYRTLIHPDGSMTHGVAEPEVEIVGEVSDEDAEQIVTFLEDPLNNLPCPECGGAGEIGAEFDTCPKCEGSGIAPDEEADVERVREVEGEAVPEGSIAVVLEWVGQDQARAERALDAELHRDPQRSTLVAQLSQLLATLGFRG